MSRYSKKQKSRTPTPAREAASAVIDTAPQAFASVRHEIEAVPLEMLVRINCDVPHAARCGLVAAEHVQPLLPDLAQLIRFDVRPVHMLGAYSLALLHAHSLATEGDGDLPSLPVLVAEAMPLRERLLRTAELLAYFGIVSAEHVAAIRSGLGYASLAEALLALGRMLVELWPRVHDKVMVTREEVDRAITLSAQLQKAIALHEADKSPLQLPSGRRYLRAQAFTLFYRAYEQTRRGVTFLRWDEGDAQGIVPSLYPRRGRRPEGEELELDEGDASPRVSDDASPLRLEPGAVSIAAANAPIAAA
jgi:hypothetical protein